MRSLSDRWRRGARLSGSALGLLVALAIPGCAGRTLPTDPSPVASLEADGGWFVDPAPLARLAELPYPLAVGNRWRYVSEHSNVVRDSAGNWSRLGSVVLDIEREILYESVAEGRRYFVQLETSEERTAARLPFTYISGFRQDARGLYEWDGLLGPDKDDGAPRIVPAAATPRMPAALQEIARRSPEHARKLESLRAAGLHGVWGNPLLPGGPAPGELSRLRYPLRRGSRWIVREIEPGALWAIVVGFGTVGLPAGGESAWRIRYDWPGVYGPWDEVELWYGRSGYLGMRARLVSTMTDDQGNPVGLLRSDIEEVLVEADLAGR